MDKTRVASIVQTYPIEQEWVMPWFKCSTSSWDTRSQVEKQINEPILEFTLNLEPSTFLNTNMVRSFFYSMMGIDDSFFQSSSVSEKQHVRTADSQKMCLFLITPRKPANPLCTWKTIGESKGLLWPAGQSRLRYVWRQEPLKENRILWAASWGT